MTLDHGEVYGKLKVLERLPTGRYRVGCVCGFSKDSYRARRLMRAGGVRECSRCRKQEAR